MQSIYQLTSVPMPKKQTKTIRSFEHWLASLSLHIILLLFLGFSTIQTKTQEIPTRMKEAAYFVLLEQDSQKKSSSIGYTVGHEAPDQLDTVKEIASTDELLADQRAYQAKQRKNEASVSLNAEAKRYTNQASEEFQKQGEKKPKLLQPILDPLAVDKKSVQPNGESSTVNEDYTKFLRSIERRDVEIGSKQFIDNSSFSDKGNVSSQIAGKNSNPPPASNSAARLCGVRALKRQAQSLGETNSNQQHTRGSNRTVRITDLLGHGRYVTPSASVRVSELLNVGSQSMLARHPNVTVTVSDLLNQNTSGYQFVCQ